MAEGDTPAFCYEVTTCQYTFAHSPDFLCTPILLTVASGGEAGSVFAILLYAYFG
jgi:hypothetical protein